MTNTVQTDRMLIRLLSLVEMKEVIENEPDEIMKTAYTEMLTGCIEHPDKIQWYGIWQMLLNGTTVLGDLCFKGIAADGMVEIGYGIKPEFERKGYTSEAVSAMTAWALSQPGVARVEAETEPGNKASQRVLEKAGFVPNGVIGEEGPRFVYEVIV